MILSLLIVFLVVISLSYGEDYPKVRVEVYYEALCPGCQEFITGSLTRTLAHDDIEAIVDLKMVPYGNTKYANGVYTCQHGVDECISDVYEQCTLYKLSGNISSIDTGDTSLTAFPFLQCMEEAEGAPTAAEGCFGKTIAKSSDLSWEDITKCSVSEGNDVQAEAADATPTHDYVPWVLVDGTLLENTNLLQQTICNDYTGPKPASCKRLTYKDSVCLNV